MKNLVIVKVGDSIAELIPRYGDYEDWIRERLCAAGVRVVDPRRGQALPERAAIAGAVVTGSQSMVTERAAWSERTGEWLADLVAHAVPVLGICYGHQLLARALGGAVGYHPRGMEIGTAAIRATAAAADDPLLRALPACFPAQTIHSQTVLRLPDRAVLLAASDFDPHHAFRVGRCAWGVQFHPEFSAAAMRGFIAHLADSLRRRGRDPHQLAAAVAETPAAASILRFFSAFAEGAAR